MPGTDSCRRHVRKLEVLATIVAVFLSVVCNIYAMPIGARTLAQH